MIACDDRGPYESSRPTDRLTGYWKPGDIRQAGKLHTGTATHNTMLVNTTHTLSPYTVFSRFPENPMHYLRNQTKTTTKKKKSGKQGRKKTKSMHARVRKEWRHHAEAEWYWCVSLAQRGVFHAVSMQYMLEGGGGNCRVWKYGGVKTRAIRPQNLIKSTKSPSLVVEHNDDIGNQSRIPGKKDAIPTVVKQERKRQFPAVQVPLMRVDNVWLSRFPYSAPKLHTFCDTLTQTVKTLARSPRAITVFTRWCHYKVQYR